MPAAGSAARTADAMRASVVIASQSPRSTSESGVSQEPPTQATFGSARKSGAVAAVMPPVGLTAFSQDDDSIADLLAMSGGQTMALSRYPGGREVRLPGIEVHDLDSTDFILI